MTDTPSSQPRSRHRSTEPAARSQLGTALRRARWTIFWERLWPALATLATVIGLFLTVSWLGLWLWLPPLGRAAGMVVFAILALAALVPFVRLRIPAAADGLSRLDRRSGLRHRPATTIADELAVTPQDPYSLALWQRPCRTHACRGARFQGGLAVAAHRGARSLRAARPRSDRCHRHLHRRRRRTLEAHRRGVRLAGRGAAGEFPRRRLGDAARLYRQAADHSCRHSSRRDRAADGETGEPVSVPAGSTLVVRATGKLDLERFRQWRRYSRQGGRTRAGRARRSTGSRSRLPAPRRCAVPATI